MLTRDEEANTGLSHTPPHSHLPPLPPHLPFQLHHLSLLYLPLFSTYKYLHTSCPRRRSRACAASLPPHEHFHSSQLCPHLPLRSSTIWSPPLPAPIISHAQVHAATYAHPALPTQKPTCAQRLPCGKKTGKSKHLTPLMPVFM